MDSTVDIMGYLAASLHRQPRRSAITAACLLSPRPEAQAPRGLQTRETRA